MCGPLAFLLLLLGPLALLYTAVVALGRTGPAGVVGAVLLVLVTLVVTAVVLRRANAWWRRTGASRGA